METTGCGTAIVTPFRADGSIDEAALQGAGELADRVRHRLSGGLRVNRRGGHAGRGRVAEGGVHCGGGGCGARAGVGRLHAQLHADAGAAGRPAQADSRRGRGAVGQSLLQQALAGGPVPALPGAGAGGCPAARGDLQHPRAHRREPRSGDGGRGWPRLRRTSRPSRSPAASCRRSPNWCICCPRGFKVFSGDDNMALGSIGVGAQRTDQRGLQRESRRR